MVNYSASWNALPASVLGKCNSANDVNASDLMLNFLSFLMSHPDLKILH